MNEKRIAERVAKSVIASPWVKEMRAFEADYWDAVYKIHQKAAGALSQIIAKRLQKMEDDLDGYSIKGNVKDIAKELVDQSFVSGDDPQWAFDNFIRQGNLKLEKDT